MPTLADLLGAPLVVEIDGQRLEFRELDLLQQGKFQRWLETRARDHVERTYLADDGERERQLGLVNDKVVAGHYEFGGPVSVQALQTPAGGAKLVELLAGVDEDRAKALYDGNLREVAAVVRLAMGGGDPKALAPVLATLGLPADFLRPKKPSSSASSTRRSAKRSRKSKR